MPSPSFQLTSKSAGGLLSTSLAISVLSVRAAYTTRSSVGSRTVLVSSSLLLKSNRDL